MADYEIVLEDLEITSTSSNHSMAVVMVVFQRMIGFHAIATFAQTMVIILVAFVTFFFNIRNFSDRIMVNLVLKVNMAIKVDLAKKVAFSSFRGRRGISLHIFF